MAMLKIWNVCLVLYFFDHSFSMQCEWTKFKLGKLNEESIQLLRNMGGSFPPGCFQENVEPMFPEDAYKLSGETRNDGIASVAYEALKDTARIFKDLTFTTWDHEKLRLFKNILSRQVENLEQCVQGEMAFSGDGNSDAGGNRALKLYFEKLNTLLKEKGQSACAWEIVRKELGYCLEQLRKFIQSNKQN
ncbi:interferon a3-like [Megalops cyprinoides]|uniref:interferon a3-like n=1 Tax=Megalops cyprinoides TaxID=118141 RepID=UPI0018641994|nr:interferon a3-like [Megalops cyprinoides]